MREEDMSTYNRYSLDTPPEECKALFAKRYGVEPERVFEMVISHWPDERPWGYMLAGPVPQKEDGNGTLSG